MDAPSRPDLWGLGQPGSLALGCAPGSWSATSGQGSTRSARTPGGSGATRSATWWSLPSRPGHWALLAMVLLSSPSLAQFDGQPWGGGESPGGGFSWDRGFRAQAAPSTDAPSFDYPLPPQHAGGDRGGSTWPPPGYSSYPGPAAPAYGGLQVDVEAPSYVRGRGSVTDRPAGQGPWSGQGQQGYRFRGDEAPGTSAWQESPYAPGYRFRPLTGEEDRSGATDGWRPIGRSEGRPPEPQRPSDAFGDRSDSWFGKYYGDRP